MRCSSTIRSSSSRPGIAERRAQEEAVELCLRERERALELDRVLGREEEEGLRHRTSRAVDGDLPFCHRFEQGRLRLRHGAVDLVDEDDVREDRAGPELEVALTLVVDREPGDVGRLQVRRALDPRRLDAVDRLRDRARQDRLGRAGHVLQQDVAAAEQRREDELDPVALAVDDGLDVVEEPLRDLDGTCERVVVCSSKRLCLHVPPSFSGRNVAIRYIQETQAWPSGLLRRDYERRRLERAARRADEEPLARLSTGTIAAKWPRAGKSPLGTSAPVAPASSRRASSTRSSGSLAR